MKNITVAIDDETYRRARIWAAERDTSVSAIVKCILTTLPARAPARKSPATRPGTATIPAWGTTVLRTTIAHLQSDPTPRQEKKIDDSESECGKL